jgi:4-amino-4-deoxy-L-arabinose transferase-like glycosyltransferase
VPTDHGQRRSASAQRPLPASQAAGLGALIELAVVMAPTATLPRAQDPAPPAPAPPPGLLADTPRKRPWRERLSFLTCEPWPLLGILVIQAGLSLRLVWGNTAFGDEGLYLWSGHLEWAHWLHGTPVPNFAAYFSGAPVVYPPIGAVADSIGGLAAARILSMIFMLISTALLYLTARTLLLGRKAAIYAAAAFGLLGPTASLAFATHDAMALMLIALSAWLAVRASGRHPEPFLLLAGLVMALANATKYASALWDPAVVAVAIVASWHAGPWIRILRGTRVAIYAGCVLGVALFRFGGPIYEHGLLITTLTRASGTTPPWSVLGDGFDYISPVIILSLLAVISSLTASRRIRFLCISVAVACWLAPVNQARIHTLTSLHKHVDFGAWFAAIAAGYVINQATGLQRERSWRIAVALATVIPFTLLSFNISGDLYRWAPADQLVARLEPLIHNGHAHYLMDPQSANIVYYYLHAEVYPGQLSVVQCAWWDPARHRELLGPQACTAAIKAHYYELIETDDAANGRRGTPGEVAVWKAIRASGAYRLIYRGHQLYHPEDLFQIWQLRNPGGMRHVVRAQR